MAQNSATFTIEDYNGETSNFRMNIGPLTEVNFLAVRAGLDNVKNALVSDAIILGELRKTTISEQFSESSDPVASVFAQRESKWLLTYRDVTQFLDVGNTINNVGFGNLYSVEIPTANLALLQANEDTIDLADIPTFVAAFEAAQNSPTGGNEISVVSMRHVGRSL